MIADLPLIWAALIAVAVLMYVLLDGFDLGVGILFPFARSPEDRDLMMASIAPVWDGNETWLVLGGGGLFAAFPLAYSILMPALYLPVTIMLIALVLRGVAFEFRANGRRSGKRFWTAMFALGSYAAAFAQGLILGGFVQGVAVRGERFAGGPFDWATPYTLLVALGLVAGYALLGASWLMVKTEDELHGDARRWTRSNLGFVAIFLVAVSVATAYGHPLVADRWGWTGKTLDGSRFLPLSPIPLIGLLGVLLVFVSTRADAHQRLPFLGAVMIFLSGLLGLTADFTPYLVPYAVTFREAAAPPNALALMLVGALIAVPLILAYQAWVYWIFRGKVSPGAAYH
jgi:cytochrome bd ubiquinol oxidase subunit II